MNSNNNNNDKKKKKKKIINKYKDKDDWKNNTSLQSVRI